MNIFIVFAAIAAVSRLFVCLGSDVAQASRELGVADQFSGNTLWHLAAMPGTAPMPRDEQLPAANGDDRFRSCREDVA